MSGYFYKRVNRGRVDFAKIISNLSGNEVNVAIVKMKKESGFHGWALVLPDMYIKEANDNDAYIIQLKKNSPITLRKVHYNKINEFKAVPFEDIFYEELAVFTTDDDIVKGLGNQVYLQKKNERNNVILSENEQYQYYMDTKGRYVINKYLHHVNEPDNSDYNKKCRKYVFSKEVKEELDFEIVDEILKGDDAVVVVASRNTTFTQKEDGFISFKNLVWEMKSGKLVNYDLTINNQYIAAFRQK